MRKGGTDAQLQGLALGTKSVCSFIQIREKVDSFRFRQIARFRRVQGEKENSFLTASFSSGEYERLSSSSKEEGHRHMKIHYLEVEEGKVI